MVSTYLRVIVPKKDKLPEYLNVNNSTDYSSQISDTKDYRKLSWARRNVDKITGLASGGAVGSAIGATLKKFYDVASHSFGGEYWPAEGWSLWPPKVGRIPTTRPGEPIVLTDHLSQTDKLVYSILHTTIPNTDIPALPVAGAVVAVVAGVGGYLLAKRKYGKK